MQIIIANSAGFCFGVQRAYNLVQAEILTKSKQPVITFGPLIHNQRVIKELEVQGVKSASKNFPPLAKVIIRSHGISNQQKKILQEQLVTVIDATCPFVTKIHVLTQQFSKQGLKIIIIGDQNHPEIQGIIEDLDNFICLKSEDEARNLPLLPSIAVVAQTTFQVDKFLNICEILKQKTTNIIIKNTICAATINRQTEAKEIAKQVDLMLIIGGKNSSNTQKLAEICQIYTQTICLESHHDLDFKILNQKQKIGITAGASTPMKQIEEIYQLLLTYSN